MSLLARWEVDRGAMIDMLLGGHIAYDTETGARLYASAGRSRSGRGPLYTLAVPGADKAHRFRADGDKAAVAHARAYLAKQES
jgi:hypothetical protein